MDVRPARTALVVVAAAFALAACGSDDGSQTAADPSGSAGGSASSATSSSAPTTAGSSASTQASSASPSGGAALLVFDVGATPQGPRLFREYRSVSGTGSVADALQELTATPTDPDYRTLWPDGAFTTTGSTSSGAEIDVELADSSLADRPSGMSAKEAGLALQQVVYTVQLAAQQRMPVQFLVGGTPAPTVFGVSTGRPVAAADELATSALVSVTTPQQGQTVSGAFTASGVASTFEGAVPWTVLDSSGKKVLHGSAQTQGDYTSLTAWQADVDVSSLAPGDYTFVASTGDASGGEGPGPTKDTKAFTVS